MALDAAILAGLGVIGFFALAWLLPVVRSLAKAAVLAILVAFVGVSIGLHLFTDRVVSLPLPLPFVGWF